ncbi:MAG: hypothetical protein AMR96_04830 [Candidatus Adiutrix intracellularis]|nr:MAG: hypothetical protein AMR96_04830 [Candidatus Adiutrix intracellularis]
MIRVNDFWETLLLHAYCLLMKIGDDDQSQPSDSLSKFFKRHKLFFIINIREYLSTSKKA